MASSRYEHFIPLARQMQEVFPIGNKRGTNSSYRGGTTAIAMRLVALENTYGTFNECEVVPATRRYVNSFHGNYDRMQVLHFFIVDCEGSTLLQYMDCPQEEEKEKGWKDIL